jgi:hypothetical protein
VSAVSPRIPRRSRPRPGRATGVATKARPTARRALAALTLLAAAAALYGVTASSAFVLAPDGLLVHGAAYADDAAVRHLLGLDDAVRPNLFVLDAARLARALRALPTVDEARPDAVSIRVALPDRLIVELRERMPILAWQVGVRRFLVDVDGVLLAEVGAAETSGLPVIADARASATGLHVGGNLEPVDLAVAGRIGAVTPAMLGSAAAHLSVEVSEDEGFVLLPDEASWRAVFGIYTPHLRSPDLVAAQVQCLASLLRGQEASVAVAYLFPEGGHCGTFARWERAP